MTSNEERAQLVNMPVISSDTQETSHSGSSISHAWRALRHGNFKLFFAGQSVSLIGTWMTRMATTWLVYRLTHSALLLGIVTFAGQIVSFVLGPFAGVWVERLDRRKLLVWTQAAAAVQSLAMAAFTLAHVINLWEIVVLASLQGLNQCVRYACAAIFPRTDGRRSQRPQ
jgi:MFS family permease